MTAAEGVLVGESARGQVGVENFESFWRKVRRERPAAAAEWLDPTVAA